MRRRSLLALATAIVATWPCLALREAAAQSWPERPVRIIVPYAAGGGTDAATRPWAEALSQAFGQQFVIENRGGASGMIGAEAAVKSVPDGYTLFATGNATISLQPVVRKTTYDPVKQLAPIARLGDLVTGFVVHASLGIRSFADLVEHARKNPGKLAYGSAGTGTTTHMRLEVLKLKTGLDILHVPYRGSGDALTDLLAGNIQVMNEIVALPHVKAGKLVLVAMNHPTRHWDFPDVPTLRELGIDDADLTVWMSLWAPAGTPAEIIDRLNARIVELAQSEPMQARMRALSIEVPIQTPAELGRLLVDDLKRNAEIVKAAGVKVE